jgi:ERCC4-type nuclease
MGRKMKYIVEIDGVVSTKYKYNVWEAYEMKPFNTFHQQDVRIFESDSKEEFLEFMESLEEKQE